MKDSEMNTLARHCDKYFGQTDATVIHPIVGGDFHVDVLLYKPSKRYPFWKLVTMGASDYRMPRIQNTFGRFNEYVMFVDSDVKLEDKGVLSYYYGKLLAIASYSRLTNTHITYGHSLEWENDSHDGEMVGAFIDMPQIILDAGVLRCKMGFFKTVVLLQTVLINQRELDALLKIGPKAFSDYLYPENGQNQHYLSEQYRSEKF